MTVNSGSDGFEASTDAPRSLSSETSSELSNPLRPLNSDEKNILYMLTFMYAEEMAKAVLNPNVSVEVVIERASAVMKVEGLLDRIIRTGLVSSVRSPLERCAS
jgi:hypothetical protein